MMMFGKLQAAFMARILATHSATAPPVILHHRIGSAFSKRARQTLALKQNVQFYQCIHAGDMPGTRLALSELAGGYRRVPVLQVGSDVYCGSDTIAWYLERRHAFPSLFPSSESSGPPSDIKNASIGTILHEYVDQILWPQLVPLRHSYKLPESQKADREKLYKMTGEEAPKHLSDARAAFAKYCHLLAFQLGPNNFIHNTSAPHWSDLVMSTPVHAVVNGWKVVEKDSEVSSIWSHYGRILKPWMERINRACETTHDIIQLTPADTLGVAMNYQSLEQPGIMNCGDGLLVGNEVEVYPGGRDDIGKNPKELPEPPVRGRVYSSSPLHITLARKVSLRDGDGFKDVQLTVSFMRGRLATKKLGDTTTNKSATPSSPPDTSTKQKPFIYPGDLKR
ncbi:hypothetical protein SmJEL517_g02415 [Synchytrium microbalum]|uniref:GST N-terminal domain-containing protein n=1 Tax=Synchytrium microbalum TaxID=1806994 RepID=A0A507C672_9FUNG|nr:uncharacterized protein SmJEL517_g02415 [Synchytrium microbalum]TPX35132.1 hypothetical protein SmJEL517_g02415 [Synchytrium microbalum]